MATVLEVRQALVDRGFTPVPLVGKRPPFKSWQKIENVSRAMLEAWGRNWPRATNTGILTARTPALDADILNEAAAVAVEELIRERFEDRGYVLPRIGKPPKRAVVFRTNDPFAKITVNLISANGGTGEKIELLAAGQQIVAAGIHPDTGKPYAWPLGNPTDIAHDDLPYLSEAEARQLVDDLAELLIRDFGYSRAAARPARKGNGTPQDHASDWQSLIDGILAGNDLHANTRDLAAKMARSSMDGGAIVNFLRGLMDSSKAPRDERWQDRYDNLPRQVDSIQEKIEREQAAAATTAQAGTPPPPPPPPTSAGAASSPASATPAAWTLLAVHKVFQKWLGEKYDIATINAVLAAAAAEQLLGDPAWLMIISGPGNAKTETAHQSVPSAALISSAPSHRRARCSPPRPRGAAARAQRVDC
jgi:hypothetical protein